VRALCRRVVAVGRLVIPTPDRTFLAYARAVVAYGGGDPSDEGCGRAAVGLTQWLERRGRTACGPG